MKIKLISKITAGTVVASILTYYASPVFAYINEETIYSKANQSGENYKSTVTTITEDKDGTNTVQLDLDKQIPIECKITYYLNGKEITAKEIAGKSGHIKIKLDYTNSSINSIKIDDEEESLYTPFIVLSGVVLDNKNNKNIEITNGKIITNGNKVIAVGITMPGLQESLNLNIDSLEIPTSIEISMDTEKFEIGNIISYSTPKIFGELDINSESFSDLFDKVNELQSASKQIEDGSVELSDGIIQLNDGAINLNDGVEQLDDGINTLQNGAVTLNDGAVTLKNGMEEYTSKTQEFGVAMNDVANGVNLLNSQYSQVNDGINTLNSSSKELNSGAQSVSEGAKNVSDNLNYISGVLAETSSGAQSLYAGTKEAHSGINEIVNGVSKQVEASKTSENIQKLDSMQQVIDKDLELITQYQNLVASIPDKTSQDYQNAYAILTVLQANYTALSGAKGTITNASNSMGELYSHLTALQQGINNLENGAGTLSNGISEISNGTLELAKGSETLANGASNLYQGTNALTQGTESLASGSSQVVSGINTLDSGTKQLNSASGELSKAAGTICGGAKNLQEGTASMLNGVNSLSNGSKELKNGTATLTSGTSQILDGANTLTSGIREFNTEGVNTICDFVNKDIKNTLKRVEKLEEISNNYVSFASKDKRDDIKFITMTDSIKVESDSNSDKKDGKAKK